MPSLRERFVQFDVKEIAAPNDFATWAYNLLKALVEAVEPEHTCGECGFFYEHFGCGSAPDDDDRLYHVNPGAAACENFVVYAKVDELRKQRDGWERGCWQAEEELAEAKKEIEKLRLRFAKWLDTHSQLVADAERWQLVRRMRDGSRLEKDREIYWVHRYLGDGTWRWMNKSEPTTDPAEALRAIQEEVVE